MRLFTHGPNDQPSVPTQEVIRTFRLEGDALTLLAEENIAQCANGVAVLNTQDNPGLVADCTALLQARDTLAGRATLNWRADRRLTDWEGITVSGSPRRVTALELSERQLTGAIPLQLGSLIHLERLVLSHNKLTGIIPSQLGTLTRLQHLDLGFNQLTGLIPTELGSLISLQELWLHINQLTGPDPLPTGRALAVEGNCPIGFNQLSGPIPPELGYLTRLEVVGLHVNRLTGFHSAGARCSHQAVTALPPG